MQLVRFGRDDEIVFVQPTDHMCPRLQRYLPDSVLISGR